MKTNRLKKTISSAFPIVLALGMAVIIPGKAFGQDHIIAIGHVNFAGILQKSANTVGGVVDCDPNGTGDYTITIEATGAFAGMEVADFVVEATIRIPPFASEDGVARIFVSSVVPNKLTILVHTDNVETNSLNFPKPSNEYFYFSVYRIPATVPAIGSTRFLLATGRVNDDGDLLSAAAVDGIPVESSWVSPGRYKLTLTKTGAFTGFSADDFVLSLSLNGQGANDQIIHGGPSLLSTDDQLTIVVKTYDIQDEVNDITSVPQNNPFHFTIYRIPPPGAGGTGLARSKLLVAMGRVNEIGNFENGAVFDGGSRTVIHNDTGDYTVTISSPGTFAGRTAGEYVLQVCQMSAFSMDRVIEGDIDLVDDDTLRLDVAINDGEQAGTDEGVPSDGAFCFVIYDAAPNYQPDLRIGRKRNLTRQKGDDIYNGGAIGQKLKVRLNGFRKKKYHFAVENDGNLSGHIFLKARRAGKSFGVKYFRLTGGRKNHTAGLTSGGMVVENVRPGETIKYQVVATYNKSGRRTPRTLRYLARSEHLNAQRDANKARLVPR